MRGNKRGDIALAHQRNEALEYRLRSLLIEIPRWLIREQDNWLIRDRPRDRDPLLFATRQPRGPVLQPLPQTKAFQQIICPVSRRTSLASRDQHGNHHVLKRGEFGHQMMELVNHAQSIAPRLGSSAIVHTGTTHATDLDDSRVRLLQQGRDMQERGFPCSRRSEQGNSLTRSDVEIDLPQDVEHDATLSE